VILARWLKRRYRTVKAPTLIFQQGEEMAHRWLAMCCIGVLACSLTAVPAGSQGKGKGHDKHDSDDDDRGKGKKKAKHEFDDQDREVITSYYSERRSNLPVVPTENSVPINQHPCGTLIADLVDALSLLARHIRV
jgi:hypothetical protein